MSEQERYRFDLQGYLVISEALNSEQLGQLNALVDAHSQEEVPEGTVSHRFHHLLEWGEEVRNLIDNARVTPYLEAILGTDFRLDHDYLDIIRGSRGPIGHTLHGGATPFDPSQYFHCVNGKFFCGLSVIAYNLQDVNEGDGGFGCVPGSHKSNFPFPQEWRDLSQDNPLVTKVIGKAGTAILFTEALTHGTLPWVGDHERRTLFFKYSPKPLSWSSRYYNGNLYPELTERQRIILNAPAWHRPK